MSDSDAGGEFPLEIMLALLAPAPVVGRRQIRVFDADRVPVSRLRDALPELSRPEVAAAITPGQLAAVAVLALDGKADERTDLLSPLQGILAERWSDLSADMVRIGLLSSYPAHRVFQALPQLAGSEEIYDVLGDLDDRSAYVIELALDVEQLPVPRPNQLRALLPEMTGRYRTDLASAVLLAAGQDGWSRWLTMASVLWRFPELAEPDASETPPLEQHQSDPLKRVHETLWRTVHADTSGRALARLLLDLRDALSQSPTDYREVYLDRLQAVVGDDVALRRAALEGLVWLGKSRAGPIAIYAATHLYQPEDRNLLEELEGHPDRQLGFTAGLIGRVVDRKPPPGTSFAARSPELGASQRSEKARTWLGDTRLERAIEDTVASLEMKVTGEYADSHRAGEDRLGERFFSVLGERFEQMHRGLNELSAARGDEHRTAISVAYRPVDRGEEGQPGIRRPDQSQPSDSFAADYCLIVTAVLNGKPLTRRAALVQAKRLYLRDNEDPAKGWAASFVLTPAQTRSLLAQTASAFFIFQGPADHGRKLGTLPAQLVDDLSRHQASSGAVLSAEVVTLASESFAEWFTYQFVALRTGDPLAELLEKAGGGPGRRPYDLARYGVVEIEVRVDEPKPNEG